MKCPTCGKEMACRRGNLNYRDCGLENVYLSDVEFWECACGERATGFFRLPDIHSSIGQALVQKSSPLSGAEIRFLRKNMGQSSKDFADLVGVDKATISRWENGHLAPKSAADRLIRLMYAAAKGIAALSLMENFPNISDSQEPAQPVHIPHGLWSDGLGSAKACLP